jgi:glycosyltransferase involved in cell wall biosynthesis
MKELAAHLLLEGIVIWKPFMERSALVREIQQADYCLASVARGGLLHMAQDVKVMEYLACGKRVIAAHDGEFFATLRGYGLAQVVPSGDFVELGHVLTCIMRDEENFSGGLIYSVPAARDFAVRRFGYETFQKAWNGVLGTLMKGVS